MFGRFSKSSRAFATPAKAVATSASFIISERRLKLLKIRILLLDTRPSAYLLPWLEGVKKYQSNHIIKADIKKD